MLTADQRKRAAALRWYHAIDFGDVQTTGRSPTQPPNQTLYGVMDMLSGVVVAGMNVLEIGPAHGVVSLGLAMKGAAVTCIDIGGKKPPQIVLGEEVFGVHIEYRAPMALAEAPSHFAPATFDLIVCAGVMYHLINPADVFFRLRPMLKRDGLLVMETVYAPKISEPVLVLNSEAGEFDQVTTYFLASASALEGMAKLACFDIEATRTNSPHRFSMTARASLPDDVRDRSDMCARMHAFGFEDPMFRIETFKDAPRSGIRYVGERGLRQIDTRTFRPDFAPSPKEIVNPIGLSFAKSA